MIYPCLWELVVIFDWIFTRALLLAFAQIAERVTRLRI